MKNLSVLFFLIPTLCFSQVGPAVYVPVDSTGATDVTRSFNEFIKTVPDGSTIHFAKNGMYMADGVLLFQNRNSISIEGNGALIFATSDGRNVEKTGIAEIDWLWPRKRSQIAFRKGSNIKINNLQIKGGNDRWIGTEIPQDAYSDSLEAQHAVDAEGIEGLTITNCKFSHVFGDFVYLGRWSAGDESWTTNVTITNNHFIKNGRQGISSVGASNVVIENNYIGYTRRATIDIEPDDTRTGSHDIIIRNNVFGPGQLLAIASGGQPGLVKNVLIEGNRGEGRYLNMTFEGPDGFTGITKENIVIRNNISDPAIAFNSPIGLINIKNTKCVTISGNKASVTPTTAGVWIWNTVTGYNVYDNAFTGAGADTIIFPGAVQACDGVIPPPPVDTIKPNQPPVVFAGNDTSITLPDHTVNINGVASDPDGDILTTSWRQLSGPIGHVWAELGDSTFLVGLTAGIYEFEMSASDDSVTVRDTVKITVFPAPVVPDDDQQFEQVTKIVSVTQSQIAVYSPKRFRFQLFDRNGILKKKGWLTNGNTYIYVGGLQPGVYVLNVSNGDVHSIIKP